MLGQKHSDATKQLLAKLRTTHGYSKPTSGQGYRTWLAWRMMFQRCYNPNHKSYKDYGGRGIHVHSNWNSFHEFLADMGIKPSGTSLNRINNDGDYCASNCRWDTFKVQARNRRSNTIITFNGQTATLQEWADRLGFQRDALSHRIHKRWSIERAFTEPMKYQKNSRHYARP